MSDWIWLGLIVVCLVLAVVCANLSLRRDIILTSVSDWFFLGACIFMLNTLTCVFFMVPN